MKLMQSPKITATPQELARVHKYLIYTFAVYMTLTTIIFVLAVLEQTQLKQVDIRLPSLLLPILSAAAVAGNVSFLIALYIAARRIGFNAMTTIGAIVLSFFLSPLDLILAVSADLRISKFLKAKGWKVGLLGAKPK